MIDTRIRYQPATVTAPGETLADLLEEQCMTQTELAHRMGRPVKTINEIIKGKAAITPETALQLEKVFTTPAAYWLNHEAHYRAYLARRNEDDDLAAWHNWLDRHPLKELKTLDILPDLYSRGKNKNILLRRLLHFFGVASPTEWENFYGNMKTAYRRNKDQSDPYATAAWLRLGELQAASASCAPFDRQRFDAALHEIRTFTLLPPEDFEPRLKALCAATGVIVALVPAIPRARVSGAARWLNNRPLIQLSLYGKTNDRFWFTFFHEACHILKHSHKLVYLDELDGDPSEPEEQEADRFAANLLIPPEYAAELPTLRSKEAVRTFAGHIGVHPGIVVGRLQHDNEIEKSWMNDLKATFTWRETPVG
ncbi:MAG: addiction module antidote protein, HigA family [Chloroflexi bacterium]|nr:MAG: addiction module antidote protein, HigA family [Chloroflexota bacterium]